MDTVGIGNLLEVRVKVTFKELLAAVEEADQIFLAIRGSSALVISESDESVVAYVPVSKKAMRRAFMAGRLLNDLGYGHNQRITKYTIERLGENLHIK